MGAGLILTSVVFSFRTHFIVQCWCPSFILTARNFCRAQPLLIHLFLRLILIDRPILQHTHNLLPTNPLLLKQSLPNQTSQPLQQISQNGISGAALKTYRWEILLLVLLLTLFTQHQLRGWWEGCDVPCGQVHRASLNRKWVNKSLLVFFSWRRILVQA